MNNQLADLTERVKARLDAIKDPISGKGLFTSGRVTGLDARADGKVSFTIEAPKDVAELYVPVRDRAESGVRDVNGVKTVIAVLTAEAAAKTPEKSAGGVGRVKQIIAVASAKGGVGKSTVAVNLACAFASLGMKTGLLDLDVYGPSAPTLLGTGAKKPRMRDDKMLEPLEAHGLKTMSIGYLVDASSPMIWRGAMATSAVRQMIDEVVWGDLDVLILDLPPGTGDVQLSLSQLIPIAGAVMVTTPQEVAIVDVVKGIAMFEKVEIPILGIVENMSYYKCPACGHTDEIFSHGGGKRLAQEVGADFFGEIPIDTRIRFGGDAGVPIVAASPDSDNAQRFLQLASKAALKIAGNVLAKPKRSPRLAVIK